MSYALVVSVVDRVWPQPQQAVKQPVSEPEPTIVEAQADVVSIVSVSAEGDTETTGEDLLSKLQQADVTKTPPPFFKNVTARGRRQNPRPNPN